MKTVGDLRRELSSVKLTWQINPNLKDTDPIPTFRPGGIPVAPKPEQILTEDQALAIVSRPTVNPFLAQRRIELGYLAPTGAPKPAPPMVPGRPPSGAPLPSVVDWRNRFGWKWITSIQNQTCSDCWAFATAALIESMVRIEHCAWAKLSESEIREGCNAKCSDGGSPDNAIPYVAANGVSDRGCVPYTANNPPVVLCADHSGRTVKIDSANYTHLASGAGNGYWLQKLWLDLVGPIMTYLICDDVFNVYGLGGKGVVTDPPNVDWSSGAGHFVLIVGYDDTQNPPAWIIKNSQGTTWGEQGFGYIGYGAVQSDTYGQGGLYGTNPDPWTKRRLHGGGMVESGDGADHDNFELVSLTGKIAGEAAGQIRHYWRDGASLAWALAETFGAGAASFPTMCQTTFNRNFETVHVTTGGRLHHWYFDQAANKWFDDGDFGPNDATTRAAFIQSNYGSPGNFEVVVRNSAGVLEHWWRNNGVTPYTWSKAATFGANVAFSGPAFVQSHYGKQGNFEVVAILANGQMQHFWRDNDAGNVWKTGESFGGNISSPACMIEGQYGAADENSVGSFELCVACAGQAQHWYRDNQNAGNWSMTAAFGSDQSPVQEVIALLEGSYGFDLEVIALLQSGQLQHFYRDSALVWHQGSVIGPA
jgi:hypothetical protein